MTILWVWLGLSYPIGFVIGTWLFLPDMKKYQAGKLKDEDMMPAEALIIFTFFSPITAPAVTLFYLVYGILIGTHWLTKQYLIVMANKTENLPAKIKQLVIDHLTKE